MKKILIADDDMEVTELLRYKLVQEGYEVISASSGTECLNKIYETKPDLLILDICMPDIEGTEIAQRLKRDPQYKDIPVIFLTALMTKQDEEMLEKEISKNVIFAKPFRTDKLLAKIQEFLET
jgi:CheY-like chemotaxis protein